MALIKGRLPKPCFGCLLGRMKRTKRGGVTDHDWRPCDKWSSDWKAIKTRSIRGYHGYFIFKDYASDKILIYMANSKSSANLIEGMKKVKAYCQLNNSTMKLFQSDDGQIFRSTDVQRYLLDNGVTYQHSAAYKKSQNGDAESGIQSIEDRKLVLMADYDCPLKYWDYAVQHAVYLHNRTPKPSNPNGLSPDQVVTGVIPDYSVTIPFYAPGMYHVTREEREAQNYPLKAKSCHYLGVPEESPKNFLVLDSDTRAVYTRGDVAFGSDFSCKFPREYHENPKEKSTIAALNGAEEIDDSWNPTYDLFLKIAALNEQRLLAMCGREEIFHDEVTLETTDGETTDEEAEDVVNSLSCPRDDADKWSTTFIAAAQGLKLPNTPKNVREALDPNNPHRQTWWDAIVKELTNLDEAGTFGPAGPKGRGAKTKLIFRVTFDNEMKLKFKARLVFCGYSQVYGIDYKATYAPTAPITIIFIMFFISGHANLYNSIFDVTAAFLEATNDYRQYCYLPSGLFGPNANYRKEVLKALYGEKQAPLLWYELLNDCLVKMGYVRCPDCYTLYKKIDTATGEMMLICVHVDDGFMAYNRIGMDVEFVEELKKYVKDVSLVQGGVKKFLGMELEKINNYIKVHHSGYIQQMEFFGIDENSRKAECPMSPLVNLKASTPNEANPPLLPVTGTLRFPADRARPDLLTSVGKVSSDGLPHPSDEHIEAAKQIVRYLKHTHNLSVNLGGISLMLFGFSDASWEKYGNCKSRLGNVIYLGYDSGAICNDSVTDTVVAFSSTESEIRAVARIIRRLIYIKNVCNWMGIHIQGAIPVYVDNQSLIDITETLKNSSKTNHFNNDIQYIRDMINDRLIELRKIDTNFNPADIHTKNLAGKVFKNHRGKIMNGFGGKVSMINSIVRKSISVSNSL